MTKVNNIRWASWVAIGLTVILTFTGMAYAYGQATGDIEDNTTAIVDISEDVDENGDDINDMKVVMAEISYMSETNAEIAEMLKDFLHHHDEY